MTDTSTIGNIWIQKKQGWIGGVVSRLTGSDWVHVGVDLGDGNIAHVDMFGKHFTKYRQWKGEVIILTPAGLLSEEQRARLRVHAIAESVWGYDFFSAIRTLFWRSKNDERGTGKFYHSAEFVAAMYRSVDVDLFPGLSDDSVQPQDFLVSSFLTRV